MEHAHRRDTCDACDKRREVRVREGMIDSHCHLDVGAFDADRAAALARAAAAGVRGVLVPAIRPSTWPALAAMASADTAGAGARPAIAIALGVHPQVVPELDEQERAATRDLTAALSAARTVAMVAIGECGLDGATGAHDEQERIFRAHLRAARELRLPVVVHVLRAHDAAPRILREEQVGDVGGVLHSYSGPPELVPVYRDLGLHFSFAGPVSWENARKPLAACRAVPADRLLAETDAPDQAPSPHRGGRSEPAFVAAVIAGMARARGSSPDEVAALTTANARRLFGPRLGVP
ncbi:MAG TPA: TatD family hydrolase [Kofleriaceae bacterium]|nr:TatD family hydrolase [Kofleriaceae bacterium]